MASKINGDLPRAYLGSNSTFITQLISIASLVKEKPGETLVCNL
jgi:hypothetical protein